MGLPFPTIGTAAANPCAEVYHTCNSSPAVAMMSRSGLNGEYYRIKVMACELETIQQALNSRNIRYTNLAYDMISMIDGELARGIVMYYDYKARNNGKDYAGMSLAEFVDSLIPKNATE